MEKYRTSQYSIHFSLPCHLSYVQDLLGSGVGIGTRRISKCSLKKRGISATDTSNYQITCSDALNIIPFENNSEEEQPQGLHLRYIPKEMELTVTILYRVLTGRQNLQPHMDDRNLGDRIRPHNILLSSA